MFAAAGMESDSESDCDIVHSSSVKPQISARVVETDSKSERSTSEFIPVSSIVANGSIHSPSFATKVESVSLPGPKNNSRNQTRRDWRRPRVISKSDQPLDDLRYAIMLGNLEVIQAIIEKGIWVDSILKAGWTGLMYACSSAHHEVVSYLLEHKADPNYHKDMFTPLMAACASSKEEDDLLKCCCQLLEYGAQVNVHERHLTSPLMFAAREGHFQIVKELLQHDANIHTHDNRGRTVLSWAASGGYGQIVHLLLNKGADPHEVDMTGQSAADLAYEQGHKEIAALLQKSTIHQKTASNNNTTEEELLRWDTLKKSSRSKLEKTLATKSLPNSKCYTTQGELELFLTGLDLSHLISTFHDQHLNFTDLLIMNEEELEKMGIEQIGIRKKILEASKAVHKKEWANSSLPNLKQCQYISCPDAVAMVANIAKHLKYISNTIIFVRQQLQAQPRILELSQDSANVHDLLDEMEDSLKNVRILSDELRFLKLHLDKVQDNVHYIPADLIVDTVSASKGPRKGTKIVLGFAVVSIAVGGLLWKKNEFLTNLATSILSRISLVHIND